MKITYKEYYLKNKPRLDKEVKIIKMMMSHIKDIKNKKIFYQKQLRILKSQFINEYSRLIKYGRL